MMIDGGCLNPQYTGLLKVMYFVGVETGRYFMIHGHIDAQCQL